MKKVFNTIFSVKVASLLSIIFILAQIKATLLPSETESWRLVYASVWFEIILWLLAAELIVVMLRYKVYKHLPVFLLHAAVLVMLIGAFFTRYIGYGGTMHIREGQASSVMVMRSVTNPEDVKLFNLGFSIKLDKFVMKKYPGSMQPASYESYVEVIDGSKHFKYHIHMNHVLEYDGYRFYQASYDRDEHGTILSVNHNILGDIVTYLGYIMLALGFLTSMFYKKGKFQTTVRSLKKGGLFAFMFVALLGAQQANASLVNSNLQSKAAAKAFSHLVVESHGRIEPADTLNADIVNKISKTSGIKGMNYNQIVVGMIADPADFSNLPMIYIGHPKIISMLHADSNRVAYNLFFNADGSYKFRKLTNDALRKSPAKRSKFDRELLNVNERVYIAYEVFNKSIFRIFPSQSSNNNSIWYSKNKLADLAPKVAHGYSILFSNLIEAIQSQNASSIDAVVSKINKIQKKYSPSIMPSKNRLDMEILYNHLHIFSRLMLVYLLLGIIIILFGFFEIFKQKRFFKLEKSLLLLGTVGFIFYTANIILRWYVESHAPWANAYESIVFIGWGSAFASLLFFRKSMMALGSGLFMAGMFLFVAHLDSIDPQITNLVPVLNSYWLLLHVSIITSSYGFLGVGAMLGLLNMILFTIRDKKNVDNQIKQISDITYLALYMGLALLTIGTFIGAVWANQSWGRYWSWDPKETWSLITIIVYALVIHTKMIPSMNNRYAFSLFSTLSFYSVLMTYFGVNFYISQGLHSYGQGEGSLGGAAGLFGILDAIFNLSWSKFTWAISILPLWFWIGILIFLIIAFKGYKNRKL